jgi:hypothetical protein
MAKEEVDMEALRKREKEVFVSERREDYGALIVAGIAILIALIVGEKGMSAFFKSLVIVGKAFLPLL